MNNVVVLGRYREVQNDPQALTVRPMAPRDMLPLRLPRDESADLALPDADRPTLELPERGPEITEIQ